MLRCILGAVLGIGLGYLAAMGIAAIFPFDSGVNVQNMSLFLALTCCTAGAVIGPVVIRVLAGFPADPRR